MGGLRRAARILELEGLVYLIRCEFALAARHYEEALGMYRSLRDPREYAARAGLACARLGNEQPSAAREAVACELPPVPPAIAIEFELAAIATSARNGHLDEAWERLAALAADPRATELAQTVSFVTGALEVENAERDRSRGDLAAARAWLDRARARQVEQAVIWPDVAWIASRWLALVVTRFERRLTEQPPAAVGAVVVDARGEWFVTPEGATVSLASRRVLKRLLAAFARREPLSLDDLFRAGWPGESIQIESARNRVWVALARLRALGLQDAIDHRKDGYSLSPSTVVRGAVEHE